MKQTNGKQIRFANVNTKYHKTQLLQNILAVCIVWKCIFKLFAHIFNTQRDGIFKIFPFDLQMPVTHTSPSNVPAMVIAFPSNIYATVHPIAPTDMMRICDFVQRVSPFYLLFRFWISDPIMCKTII